MVTHSLVEVVPSLLQHTNPQKNLIHKFTPELSGLNWQLFKEDKMEQKKQQTKRTTQFLLIMSCNYAFSCQTDILLGGLQLTSELLMETDVQKFITLLTTIYLWNCRENSTTWK
jgi:hypothetical protein